ncbi:hypothetical protein [Bacillus sp. JCM 19034]|uniref:hypothetical protein n=1 Tax=Bacillus sp. JCM 19034 TaxID=1481928 RepID=UPI0007825E99|nr:hypothetical protein [Bacillus sp. JCM 19034]
MDYCLQVREHELSCSTDSNVKEDHFVSGILMENRIERIETVLSQFEEKNKEQNEQMNFELTSIQNTLLIMKEKVAAFNEHHPV